MPLIDFATRRIRFFVFALKLEDICIIVRAFAVALLVTILLRLIGLLRQRSLDEHAVGTDLLKVLGLARGKKGELVAWYMLAV